jgi:hypothetical protein
MKYFNLTPTFWLFVGNLIVFLFYRINMVFSHEIEEAKNLRRKISSTMVEIDGDFSLMNCASYDIIW